MKILMLIGGFVVGYFAFIALRSVIELYIKSRNNNK